MLKTTTSMTMAAILLASGMAGASENLRSRLGPAQKEFPAAVEDQGVVPPMEMPEIDDLNPEDFPPLPKANPKRQRGSKGRPPADEPAEEDEDRSDAANDYLPMAAATNGMRHTTSRVFPPLLTSIYPYITVGRLLVADWSGRRSSCSGVVIERRIVLTAGHCVYDAQARRWNAVFVFEPGFYDRQSGAGAWQGRIPATTNLWINGGGVRFPNYGDIAAIIMHDRDGRAIGEVTGFMGVQPGVIVEHVHAFGYPAALDSGLRMQETAAQTAQHPVNQFPYGPIAFMWASTQTQGSSGGPVVMNFGVNANENFPINRVIGVVSFGNPSQGISGAAILRDQFTNLLRLVCREATGNCFNPL